MEDIRLMKLIFITKRINKIFIADSPSRSRSRLQQRGFSWKLEG